jgi:NIPSNAP
MFIEERMYRLYPGKVPEYFRAYETYGMPVQLKYQPHMLGYYVTEVGPQNMVVHMWAYDDLNQRTRCREALFADPGWQAYRPMIQPFLMTMDTRIMKCAPFFVERLKRMLAADKGQG